MSQGKKKHHQLLLNELIEAARGLEIEIRVERLLHEVGSYIRSGSCLLHEKKLIILNRDLSLRDQIDRLAEELHKCVPDVTIFPPHLQKLLAPSGKRIEEEVPVPSES
jgi:hypothetical protein